MSERNQRPPLGLLLKNAGLINNDQLQNALKFQSKYTQMKLGEILVLQEGIEAETIDFFVEQWYKFIELGQQFPIGYYLKKASLLNAQQIKTILQEQKKNRQKFGAIAVQKGWIRPTTVEFFLNALSFRTPQAITFKSLEEYDREVLHLKKRYINHLPILSRILAWTSGNFVLTKTIAHAFAESDFNIAAGSEMSAVDRFVENSLIKHWQTSQSASYLRAVKRNLIESQKSSPISLLQEYRNILLAGSKKYTASKEQNELLTLGLVAPDREKLRVANLIYQQVFNQDWTVEQLSQLKPNQKAIAPTLGKVNNTANDSNTSLIAIEPKPRNRVDVASDRSSDSNKSSPNPIIKVGSLITMAVIALLISMFLTDDNYYLSQSKSEPIAADTSLEELRQLCSNMDFNDLSSSLKLISRLENSQRELQKTSSGDREVFPRNCQQALNRLRVWVAPQLGKENRVLEAVQHLCQVSSDSEVYLDAEVWLKRWYDSPNWGDDIAFYLTEFSEYKGSDCPAAHFTEYEES